MLKVCFQDKIVGYVSKDKVGTYFSYAPSWVMQGIELSPILMGTKRVPEAGKYRTATKGFHGLPGLLHDCLPDTWGMAALRERLRRKGIELERLYPEERLAFMGNRAMGALTFEPDKGAFDANLIEEINWVQCERLNCKIDELNKQDSFEEILFVAAGSAGGAKPKYTVGIKDERIFIGPSLMPEGFEHWLLKFSRLKPGEPDRSQWGRIEYAFSLMARDAGLDMPPTRLLEFQRGGGEAVGCFAVRRFDRKDGSGEQRRVHMHTFMGLTEAHYDLYDFSYRDLLAVNNELTQDASGSSEILRRMTFNVATGNVDDHTRNHAFLMNEAGQWKLSPVYDLMPFLTKKESPERYLAVNGNHFQITQADVVEEFLGQLHSARQAQDVIEEVLESVTKWPDYAAQAGLTTERDQEVGEFLNRRVNEFQSQKTARKR